MKKILCVALFSLIAFAGQAQFGAKGGVNFSTWHGDNVDDAGVDGLFGMYLGFYYNWACGDHFSVEPQLVFSTEGVKADDGDAKIRLDMINLTALAKYNFKGGFFLGVGPQLGFIVSAKEKEPNVASFDVKEDFGSVNFAIAMALGYDMRCGFGLYGRFNLGVTSLLENGSDLENEVGEIKQNVWQFGVRYLLSHNNPKKASK